MPAVQFQPIPLDNYRTCTILWFWRGVLGFTSISLVYGTEKLPYFHLAGDTHADDLIDFLAFSLVVYLALQWKNSRQLQAPGSLFRIVAQDATLYFLVIFTSHLTLEMTIIFGGVRRPPYGPFPLTETSTG